MEEGRGATAQGLQRPVQSSGVSYLGHTHILKQNEQRNGKNCKTKVGFLLQSFHDNNAKAIRSDG